MENTNFWDDKIKHVPICQDLLNNYDQIKKEVLDFICQPNILFDYPKYNIGMYDLYQNYWKACPLTDWIPEEYLNAQAGPQEREFFKFLINRTKENCPTSANIIKDLEEQGNISNGFISRLLPGTIINPHRGWVSGWIRTHLGLVCDPKCKITLGSETRSWEEGKLLAFHDGGNVPHSVKHEGSNERVIISVDIKIEYLKNFIKGGEHGF